MDVKHCKATETLTQTDVFAWPLHSQLIPPLYCRSQRQVAVCSYQNGSQQFGNTASGSNRAALTETIDAPIDVSREVVTTQTVPLPGLRKSYRVSFFGEMPLVHCTVLLVLSHPFCLQKLLLANE